MSSLSSLQARAEAAEQAVAKAKTRQDALEAAITAAESYMQALKLTDNAADKQKLDASCREYLNKAEKIKNDDDWRRVTLLSEGASDRFLAKPTSLRKLTTKEQIIILEGSKLNGFVFPPWKGHAKAEEFKLIDGTKQFEDLPRLDLSNEQQEIFDGWKRPAEALTSIATAAGSEDITKPTMVNTAVTDLVQDATSDCSIVASLCVSTARAERGHSKVGPRNFFLKQQLSFV